MDFILRFCPIFLCCALFSSLAGCDDLMRPRICNSKGTRYQRGHKYEYIYTVTTSAGASQSSAGGSRLTCQFAITVPDPCELILKVDNCNLEDQGLSDEWVQVSDQENLVENLKRNEVYLHYDSGEVTDNRLLVFDSEPKDIINIKRGLVSLLQLKTLPDSNYKEPVLQHDIFGSCLATVSTSQDSEYHVQTYRDLVTCNLTHVNRRQAEFLSFIKTIKGGHKKAPISEVSYPFKSSVSCWYSVSPSETITDAQCLQTQSYVPLSNGGDASGSPMANISQRLQLVSDSYLGSHFVDHSLNGRHWVDLAMEFELEENEEHTSKDVEDKLEQMMDDYLHEGDDITLHPGKPADRVKNTVNVMRKTSQHQLRKVKMHIFSCRDSPVPCYRHLSYPLKSSELQFVKERLFTNSLMSCGTDSCMTIFADCIKDGLLPEFETRSIIFNMGLFYYPSTKFVSIIFNHCKNNGNAGCWLALSAMVSRLTDSPHHNEKISSENKAEVENLVHDIISHLRMEMIGDNCQFRLLGNVEDPTKIVIEEQLLTAIKAFINIGESVETMYNSRYDNGKSITPALLQCVMNEHISPVVGRAAIKALNQIGLRPIVASELFGIFKDEKRPVMIRAAIFDVLIFYEDEGMLDLLLGVMHSTKIENMQAYIVTKVSSVLECFDPKLQGLRTKLRSILKYRILPDLGDNILSKSHFTQLSRHYTVPLTSLRLGGYLVLNLIYTPTSNVFQSLTIKSGYAVDGKTTHLFEFTVDLEDMDSILEIFKKMDKQQYGPKGVPSPFSILELLLESLQKADSADIPTFVHYSNKVKLALKRIFQIVNIKKASFPFARVSYKFSGYEMGWFSSDSILKKMKELNKEDDTGKEFMKTLAKGIHLSLLRAFELFNVHKVLPTVSGFPLDVQVHSTMITKSIVSAKSDMESFAKTHQLITDIALIPSVSVSTQANMKVSLGNYTSSGVGMKSEMAGVADLSGVIKFQPRKRRLQLVRKLGKEKFNFFNIMSDLHLLHNDQSIKIDWSESEKQTESCLPAIYTQMSGFKTCLTGIYSDGAVANNALPIPLIGPFQMKGSLTPEDPDLNHYFIDIKHQYKISEKLEPQGYLVELMFEGPGTELSRKVSLSIDKDYASEALEVLCNIPDARLNYTLQLQSSSSRSYYNKKTVSVLSQHGKILSSYISESKSSQIPKTLVLPDHEPIKYEEKEEETHFNISMGAVSIDLNIKDFIPGPTYMVKEVALSYYCDPNLQPLYALHPDPKVAAGLGHTSKFALYHEINDSQTVAADTVKVSYRTTVLLPGQNITQITNVVGDLKKADRLTDIYWTYGDKMDLIHMDSHVQNKSTKDLFDFRYIMKLNNIAKFNLGFDISVNGPRANPFGKMNVTMDIDFKAKEDISRKRTRRSLSTFLSQLSHVEEVVGEKAESVYKAAKSGFYSLWGQSETDTVKKTNVEITSKEDYQKKGNEKLNLWEMSQWRIGVDSGTRMIPHVARTPTGKKISGIEFCWRFTARMPREGDLIFKSQGSIFRGKNKWMKVNVEDKIHNLKFIGEAEHFNSPQVFHHHHNWTLVETDKHSLDRSFNFRIDFMHHQHFEYDLKLVSPQTNLTHHINYTKISQDEHTVRAHAWMHSVRPPFDLLYYESSDMVNGNLTTQINLTSTVMDYELDLKEWREPSGVKFKGNFHLDGRLPFLKGERTLSFSLAIGRRQPPISEWTFIHGDGSRSMLSIAMLDPQKISIGARFMPPGIMTMDNPMNSVTWLIELTKPRLLQHTITFSPQMLHKLQYLMGMIQKTAADSVKQKGEIAAQNILLDLKDKIVPGLNQSVDAYLKSSLHYALSANPQGKMVKGYKMAIGGIGVINKIWLDRPEIQLFRGSHLDQAMAGGIQLVSNILSKWILQPPFFLRQFSKFYVYPTLHKALAEKTVTFTTPLPFVTLGFNKLPQMTVIEKEMLALLKRRVSGAVRNSKDIAMILDGKRIKTFDDLVFDLTDPPKTSCTYLLGMDVQHGQFALTYNKEGVTAVTNRYGLTLARDGSVTTIGDVDDISALPYSSPDGQLSLSLHDGGFHLTLANGVADVAFDPDSDFYLFELDRRLNNASVGLLGTNNMEKGDDLLLPDGSQAQEMGQFQNSYELMGNAKCTVSSSSTISSCKQFDFPACMSLSDQWSEVLPCFLVLNPRPFILQCQIDECQDRSGCGAVKAYLTACHHQGLSIGLPPACDFCQMDRSGIDIVFVQSLHHNVIKKLDPLAASKALVRNMAKIDLRVGVVTYGGADQWEEPKSQLLNGKLLEKGKRATRRMELSVEPGKKEISADSAVLIASDFPFRSHATRIILLMHHHLMNPDKQNISQLRKAMKSKGITLISASAYPEFSSKTVLGLWSNGSVIGKGRRISAPKDTYSGLVTATKGIWLDLDTLNSGRVRKIKQVAAQLKKIATNTDSRGCSP